MTKKINKDWFGAMGVRAVKTMAQTALGMITVGAAISEIEWIHVLSVVLVSGLLSVLTSLAGNLPELEHDGKLLIDTNDPTKDSYLLEFDQDLASLQNKKKVTLIVDSDAHLGESQQ